MNELDKLNLSKSLKVEMRNHLPKGDLKKIPCSITTLSRLGFDPIVQLVKQYNVIVDEIELQERIRDGRLTELDHKGNVKRYSYKEHMILHDRLTNISKELLRYGYGRVSETIQTDPDNLPTFNVILNNGD